MGEILDVIVSNLPANNQTRQDTQLWLHSDLPLYWLPVVFFCQERWASCHVWFYLDLVSFSAIHWRASLYAFSWMPHPPLLGREAPSWQLHALTWKGSFSFRVWSLSLSENNLRIILQLFPFVLELLVQLDKPWILYQQVQKSNISLKKPKHYTTRP